MSVASALYEGTVRHARTRPTENRFEYPLYLLYLDLDELEAVFDRIPFASSRRPAPVYFRRRDYLGDPAVPLAETVRRVVAGTSGRRADGPIRVLTHPRTFGHCFNPVSFYYCFDRDERLQHVVSEIHNTPWGERHVYVLSADGGDATTPIRGAPLEKTFHVSPFMPMEVGYRWTFATPGERLAVHMENHDGDGKLFDASLALERRPLTAATLASALVRRPFVTVRVVFWIYLQAARLWLKGTPFHAHPAKRADLLREVS